MTEYQIQANTRRCCVTGRDLQVGETYFSVLVDDGQRLVRQDYSKEAWAERGGPPANAFSFWVGRISAPESKRRQPIDDEMLLDCFQRLDGQTEPGRIRFRYVVALLLMRRRRFTFEEAVKDAGQEELCLRCTRTGALHRVVNPCLTEEEMVAVQEEVFQALGWE
jgi:hypothetical protein